MAEAPPEPERPGTVAPAGVPPTAADGPGSRSTAALLVAVLLLLAGAGLCLAGLLSADWRGIGSLGLVEAMPVVYFVGLVLVSAAAGLSLLRTGRAHERVSWACAVVLVLVLHAAPGIVEPVARFNTAWLHVGFSDFVASTGRTAPSLDARFSWPAFFGLSAAVQEGLHLGSAARLLRYWPVVLNLLYLPLVHQLSLRLVPGRAAASISLLAFPVLNWVGQDYYSPQSVATLLLLGVLLAVLTFFPGRVGDGPREAVDSGRLVGPYVLVLTMFAALTVEHQLTPVAVVAVVAVLALTRQVRLPLLPVWMGLLVLGWLSLGATAYWQGHRSQLFGGIGQLGGNILGGTSDRVSGSDAHTLVARARLLLSLVVWASAAWGVATLRGWGRVSSAVLLVSPFLVLLVQSYGGEGTIRVFLYTLPVSCAAIGALVVRYLGLRLRCVAVGLLLVLAMPFFLLSRWGNESFEQTRPDERTALRALYTLAPPGSTIAALTPQLAWRSTRADDYRYLTSTRQEFADGDVSALRGLFSRNPRGTYLIVTTGQLVFGEQAHGLPHNWSTRVEQAMTGSGELTLLYSNPDARIYAYRKLLGTGS